MNLKARNKSIPAICLLVTLSASFFVNNAQSNPASSNSVKSGKVKRTYFFGLGEYQIYAKNRKNGVLYDVKAIKNSKVFISCGSLRKSTRNPNNWILYAGLMLVNHVTGKKPKLVRIVFENLVLDKNGEILIGADIR